MSLRRPPGSDSVLIIVAKRPAPGRTKTRLSPPLTPAQAADLYECFLKDTVQLVRALADVQPAIAYLPAGEASYFTQLAPGFERLLQRGRNLGERLDHALSHFLERGYRRVAVMNSDSPTLPRRHLHACFERLTGDTDVVIGPCVDGGYYLLGTRRPVPGLTRDVSMSTPRVTADTLALAAEQALSVQLLPPWYDVDDVQALSRLAADLANRPGVARHTRRFIEHHRRLLESL